MSHLGNDAGAFITSETFIHHRYTVVPSDQQELLRRPDAWNTKGPPNIPPKVLQNAKETFTRQLKPGADSVQGTPLTKGSGRLNGTSLQNHGRPERAAEDSMEDGQDHEHSADDEGVPIPWSSSPTHHRQAPFRHGDLPTLRPINIHPRSSAPFSPDKMPLPSSSPPRLDDSHVPSSSPLRARQSSPHKVSQTPPRNTAHSAPFASTKARIAQREPPSSLTSEPDLEYQPPRAITDVVSPVGRVLRSKQPPPPVHRVLRYMQKPAPTPPSAQEPVTVPCTWGKPSNPDKGQHISEEPPVKRRRMRVPQFDSSQPADLKTMTALSGGRQAPVSLDDSQASNSSSASSVIPRAPKTRVPNPHLGRGSTMLLGGERFAVFQPPNQVIQLSEDDYDSSQLGPPAQNVQSRSSTRPPPNGPASQAPFVAFCTAYPSYKGTVRDFVSAAISIQDLQQRRSLPDFLYDDYIRVWAHEYISYVRKCVKERKKTLHAIEWYNEYVPGPEYNKRIFTRGNIADITEHNRAEAELLRNLSREHREQSDNDTSSMPAATSHLGSEDLPRGGYSPKREIPSTPPASSLPVATPGMPHPGSRVLSRGGPGSTQPAQPVATPNVITHASILPDQIERIEPLRSVPGYVVTLSQPEANHSNWAYDKPAARLHSPPEIKDEDDDLPQAQLPPSKPSSDPKDVAIDTRAASNAQYQPRISENPTGAYNFLEEIRTLSAHLDSTMRAVEKHTRNNSDNQNDITRRAMDERGKCLDQWNIALSEFDEFFSHSLIEESVLRKLRILAVHVDWERAKALLSAAHDQRLRGKKRGRSQDAERWSSHEVDVALVQCVFPRQGSDANSPSLSEPAAELKTRSDMPSLRSTKRRAPSSGETLPLATAAPGPSPLASKTSEAQWKRPSAPRPKSPSPSFGDVLTQPPATAVSVMSDITASAESIPETAIKPRKDARLNTWNHGPPAFSSASRVPASSAVSSSMKPKGKKLSKADRFRMFVEKRQAQSSAPRSTIQD